MSRYLIEQVAGTTRIEVRCHTEVRELLGDDVLEGVVIEDNQTGERCQRRARALFVFVGAPNSDWLGGPERATGGRAA